MNKKSNKLNNILLFAGAVAVPYLYFMTVRPKLIQIEKTFDDKITGISDKELEKMKQKMEMMKSMRNENLEENKLLKVQEEEIKEGKKI
jgi:hypothetical protein